MLSKLQEAALEKGLSRALSAKDLFAKGAKKGPILYRAGSYPMQEDRFSRMLQNTIDPEMTQRGEPLGSYYATHPKDIVPLLNPGAPKGYDPILRRDITAVPVPGARYREFSVEEWKEMQKRFPHPKKLTKELKKEYDLINIPDINPEVNQPDIRQVVQLNPKKVIRRSKERGYALFGTAGALGGSMGITDLLQPREAEAMPRGVYQKITQAAMSGEVSSAAKVLVGQILDGKTIKDVRKGNGNWRGLIFDDDTMMTVTNTELNDLSRAYGTKKYTSTFMEKEGPSRTEQALKSLDYHYSRVKPFITKGTTELYHQRHAERLKEMGMEPPPRGSLVSYKGRFFTMPTEYARHLEELGLLKVEKEIK